MPSWPTFGSDGGVLAGLEAAVNQDEDKPRTDIFLSISV
jgi:hypothetical protein